MKKDDRRIGGRKMTAEKIATEKERLKNILRKAGR